MKLRGILISLSILVLLSAATGGILYYDSLSRFAFREGYRQGALHAQTIKNYISSFLLENRKSAGALAGLKEIRTALVAKDPASLSTANAMLDYFNQTLAVDVCYLMDREGMTIATSNRGDPDSFLGRNFAFRPYFQEALAGKPSSYMALGTTSKKRGVYYSSPVYGAAGDTGPIGVAVIKASIEPVERQFHGDFNGIIVLADPHGVVFVSNRDAWLYHLLWALPGETIAKIKQSRQFGKGPRVWIGLEKKSDRLVVDQGGLEYLFYQLSLEAQPGWNIVYLIELQALSRDAVAPLLRNTSMVILGLCLAVSFIVMFLYRNASGEIRQRKLATAALQKSEARYRMLYQQTPALMHSVGPDGRLISVSDTWLKALGYQREEVMGRHLTEFLTEDSRRYALRSGIPDFFATGKASNLSYQFVRKDGSLMDVVLSAISERDARGDITKSLAVCLDVTEQNRARKDLQAAQQKLSRYSRELERRVARRTAEITGILSHTPSVIAMKDLDCRYVLINARFETLFGVSKEAVRGKTDHDLFPKETADSLRSNDEKVIERRHSIQVEEQLPLADGMHTYLSVKFPVLNEKGEPYRLCGISMDITELKKAQNQLRRLSAGVIAGQEQERAAIARELHDQLGQVLTVLRIDAVWLRDRLRESDPEAGRRARMVRDLIDTTLDEVRSMALRLRPGVLDTLGLVDALEWHTTDFEKRTGVICTLRHRKVPDLSDTIAITAYRIVQEALTNVVRHAGAHQVEVTLEAENGCLRLSVTDDGLGFDPARLEESEGLGVAGMLERAALLGGRLTIVSRPGSGTQLSCVLSIGDAERRLG